MVRATPILCDFQDGGCHDNGCKIGACALEIAERRVDEDRAAARNDKIRAKVAWLADHRFKVTDRRQATAAEIKKFAAMPEVWTAAEMMVDDEEGLLRLPLQLDL
jgi:hypothetical protein